MEPQRGQMDIPGCHGEVMTQKLTYWPFAEGIHRSPVNSLTKASNADFDISQNKWLNKQSSCM